MDQEMIDKKYDANRIADVATTEAAIRRLMEIDDINGAACLMMYFMDDLSEAKNEALQEALDETIIASPTATEGEKKMAAFSKLLRSINKATR